MIALKLSLYQNMVNFRRENSFGHVQSYPLPTPSMVRGMSHELLELTEYYPLKISIQGDFDTIGVNVQKVIKFDRDPKARPTNPYSVIVGESKKTATHSIAFVDALVNCNLVLHIAFDDEELTKKLYKKVLTKTVVLGRNEDIARVDFENTKLTDIKKNEDSLRLANSILLDKETAKKNQLSGTHYRLPFYYKQVKSYTDYRIFHFVDCVYITKGEKLEDDFFVDEDNLAVSFLGGSIEI